ncbi:MAG: hypothetical protein Q4C46_10235 [Bacillota bacterium]|nr:hypothetical protein [Bacillota bacterium]
MYDYIEEFFYTRKYNRINGLISELSDISRTDLIKLVCSYKQQIVKSSNIPQYSDFYHGTTELVNYLRKSGDFGPSFLEIGKHYSNKPKKRNTYEKYGENHAKLAESLGLVVIRKEIVKRTYLSDLGSVIETLPFNEQIVMLEKLCSFIPIVQYCLINDVQYKSEVGELLLGVMSESTAIRRTRNTWDLIQMTRGEYKWD